MKKYFYSLILVIGIGCMTKRDKTKSRIDKYYRLSTQYYEMATDEIHRNKSRSDSLEALAIKYNKIADSMYADFLNPEK